MSTFEQNLIQNSNFQNWTNCECFDLDLNIEEIETICLLKGYKPINIIFNDYDINKYKKLLLEVKNSHSITSKKKLKLQKMRFMKLLMIASKFPNDNIKEKIIYTIKDFEKNIDTMRDRKAKKVLENVSIEFLMAKILLIYINKYGLDNQNINKKLIYFSELIEYAIKYDDLEFRTNMLWINELMPITKDLALIYKSEERHECLIFKEDKEKYEKLSLELVRRNMR